VGNEYYEANFQSRINECIMSHKAHENEEISVLFKIALRHSHFFIFLHFSLIHHSCCRFCFFHSNICVNSFPLNWIQSSNDETMFRHFFSYFASSLSPFLFRLWVFCCWRNRENTQNGVKLRRIFVHEKNLHFWLLSERGFCEGI
jgi:hypothetical protein